MKATDKIKLEKRIRALKELTDEERSALLGLLNDTKTYGLVWEDKPEEVEERLREELPVLKEVPSRAIISDNAEAPNHILIEGDNLEALTTLAYTHEGKIDIIYIDPPYNTGNKDFVYNDSYVDTEDSYRHSKWLSFMYKRLRIAKKLLSDRGVIFISIDDNEQANLKLLCDEIFGVQNFIGTLPRITKKSGKDHSDNIAKNHDFVLIFSKSISAVKFNGVVVEENGYSNEDEYVSTRGKYKLNQTLDYDSLWYNPAMDFSISVNGETYYPGGSEDAHISRHNGLHNPKDWVWRWSLKKFEFGMQNGFVVFKKGKKGTRIYTKTYLNASIGKDGDGYKIVYSDRRSNLSSLIFVENEFSNDNAKKQMAEVIDGNAFDFPKPVSLLQAIFLQLSPNACILDFFAGSGTTLHAVMQLNAEDGGKRQCILCTNNENGICENVTYERNKRVISGYTKPNGEVVEGLHDNNLRYYRTAFVSRRRTPQNMRRLMLLASDMLCIKENIYTEVDEFAGLPTLENGFRFYDDGNKQMLIIYNEEAIYTIVDALEEIDVEKPIITYVFSPANDPWNTEFESVGDKVKLTALPAAIYNAYKRVLPKPKDTIIKEEETETTDEDENLGGIFDTVIEEGGEA